MSEKAKNSIEKEEIPNSFEDGICHLETIINKLEQNDVPLEEALNLFQEGIGLVKYCNKLLNNVEKQMQILLEGEDGQLELKQTVLFREG